MSKTFICGKLGKSISFNPNKWSAIGGDNEPPTLIRKMAETFPDDNFIIIGRNDLDRNPVDLPPNVYNAWAYKPKGTMDNIHEYLPEVLKGIQIDGGFVLSGPTGIVNLEHKLYTRDSILNGGDPVFCKVTCMNKNYSGPFVQYFNETNLPWVYVNTDPRHFRLGRDMMNLPAEILSQFDGTFKYTPIKSFEDQNIHDVFKDYRYAGVEKICLIGKSLPEEQEKDIPFMIVLNEGLNGVKSRYDELNKYVLRYMEDVEVYGKWSDNIIENDSRFKGPKPFSELQEILPRVKYTFVIPITKGWVTSKWVEMIVNGVIPFFHPEYDMQNHTGVPKYLRIKNPKDLSEKIKDLEENPAKYKALLKRCYEFITEEDFSGEKLCHNIMNTMLKYEGIQGRPFDGTFNVPEEQLKVVEAVQKEQKLKHQKPKSLDLF